MSCRAASGELCELCRGGGRQDGKKPGDVDDVAEVLSKLCLTMYSWDELQRRPLPDGVDPLRLECYLVDDEFEVPNLRLHFTPSPRSRCHRRIWGEGHTLPRTWPLTSSRRGCRVPLECTESDTYDCLDHSATGIK